MKMISKLWLPEIYELICFNAHGLCRECGPMRFNHTKSERKIKRGRNWGLWMVGVQSKIQCKGICQHMRKVLQKHRDEPLIDIEIVYSYMELVSLSLSLSLLSYLWWINENKNKIMEERLEIHWKKIDR